MDDNFKKSLCIAIVEDYCYINNVSKKELSMKDVLDDGRVGIAMQYLGLTEGWPKEDLQYINDRGGVIKTYVRENGKPFILSLRDILEN